MPRYSREEWKVYKNVFDAYTNDNLMKLQAQGHFDVLVSPITLGKEANVFTARKGEQTVAVKIYRWMNCNFNKMHEYLSQDERFTNMKNQKRQIVLAWVQREYHNLNIAREYIPVPIAHTVRNNIIVMDFIGEGNTPAPMLKDHVPEDPQAFYDEVRVHLKRLKEGGLVHGDISAFNILNHNNKPIFIDFSQATTTKSLRAEELYERDIKQLDAWLAKVQR